MKIEFGARSHKGKVKKRNEDHYSVIPPDYKDLPYFIAVSDGVGGRNAGDMASVKALQTIGDYLLQQHLTTNNIKLLSSKAVKLANQNLILIGNNHEELAGMGTTIVIGIILGNDLHLISVGDSRGYIITKSSEIKQITVDHSWTNELIIAGKISQKEAKKHPHRHHLLKAIGVSDEITPDYFKIPLDNIRWILLCTDGLTEHISDKQIRQVLDPKKHPQKCADQFVNLALSKGGTDNITLVVAKLSN
ncbi:MAG: Stp1/IreP family PP2C-type Ser/Thr phosphatase [Caldisericia bacterium]|nr:Stp1/IreP family PP2C-type Ser/Thr phosphatase [Caldisericia bacterium]